MADGEHAQRDSGADSRGGAVGNQYAGSDHLSAADWTGVLVQSGVGGTEDASDSDYHA